MKDRPRAAVDHEGDCSADSGNKGIHLRLHPRLQKATGNHGDRTEVLGRMRSRREWGRGEDRLLAENVFELFRGRRKGARLAFLLRCYLRTDATDAAVEGSDAF